ncbi:MAG: hypothetical protein ACQEVA_08440 [Myxococcota bacterium]
MSEDIDLKELSERIATEFRAEYPRYEGEDVRVDAGDPGMIYVALRGARRQPELGRALADEVAGLVEGLLAESPLDVDFAVSLGAGDEDLLLQIELREV